ncbi:hypothetical protein DL95DRAFT_467186 [Leptodontidium sp. 2 PMI_412]|nr:hypothetical protein DL95DRAFT_467186 [Leptodontidium sp. 2 PMI_412]
MAPRSEDNLADHQQNYHEGGNVGDGIKIAQPPGVSTFPAATTTRAISQDDDENGEDPSNNLNTLDYMSHPNIEIDDDNRIDRDSDADSALGSMPVSSTVSLRDSVYEYIEEYIGPNDEIEQERLDLQHHLFVMTMDNKLHLAPIDNLQYVLDIATGTGIWAIEFAQLYPSSTVLSTFKSAEPQFKHLR